MRKGVMWMTTILGLSVLLGSVAMPQDTPTKPESSEATARPSGANDPAFKEHYPRYQLVPGDTIEATFEYSPEFNQTLTVQPDGFITLRDVGDMHVEGKTVPELTAMMRDSYSKVLADASIAVVVKDFEKPYFT